MQLHTETYSTNTPNQNIFSHSVFYSLAIKINLIAGHINQRFYYLHPVHMKTYHKKTIFFFLGFKRVPADSIV